MAGATTEYLGRLQSGEDLLRAVCELLPSDGEALAEGERPRWIHILPGGSQLEARDGRKLAVESHSDVIAASELPMLVDWEHMSEGGETRAAGWVEELKIEPPSAGDKAGIWGRVNWTDKGTHDVKHRQYRFLSPVVTGKREPGVFHVKGLRSVALTNRPALRMQGIETLREQLSHRLGPIATEPADMTLDKTRLAICTAFGLTAEASDEQLAEAAKPIIAAAKTGNESASLREACASLTIDLSNERRKSADLDKELATFRAKTRESDISAFFDKGSREGRIPPAARTKWLAFCQQNEQNFETFKTVIYPNLTVVAGNAPPPPKTHGKEKLSSKNPHGVDRAVLKSMGFTEEQILASEKDVFERKPARFAEGDDDEDDEDDEDDKEADDNADEGEAIGS